MLSKRIERIEESGIRKIFELAAKGGGEFVNLSIGQPHFSTPKALQDSAGQAIEAGNNTYTPTSGILPLREKIADKLSKQFGKKVLPEEIMITSGTSGAIFLVLSALFDAGDEVILPDPFFVLYKQVLDFLEVKINYLDTYPDFHLGAEKLEKIITPKTKAIILNSPNNPTGAVYAKEELEKIAEIAEKNGLYIISDEIYSAFDYENKFCSVASLYEKTLTLDGFSKSHSITGWRVGYVHGPKDIIAAMNKLQQYTFVCAPSFAQHALCNEFEVDISGNIECYRKNRDLLYNTLKDKYELVLPEGAFYAFIKIPDGQMNFVDKLIEQKLLVVPGDVFSKHSDYFRISYAVDTQTLQKGLDILLRCANE